MQLTSQQVPSRPLWMLGIILPIRPPPLLIDHLILLVHTPHLPPPPTLHHNTIVFTSYTIIVLSLPLRVYSISPLSSDFRLHCSLFSWCLFLSTCRSLSELGERERGDWQRGGVIEGNFMIVTPDANCGLRKHKPQDWRRVLSSTKAKRRGREIHSTQCFVMMIIVEVIVVVVAIIIAITIKTIAMKEWPLPLSLSIRACWWDD